MFWATNHCADPIGDAQGASAPEATILEQTQAPLDETLPTDWNKPRQTSSIIQHPTLVGFRFLRCEEANFFCENWRVLTPIGEEKTLYRFFGLTPRQAVEGLARFGSLTHPGLLPVQFLCGHGEQILLLGDLFDHTLRDTFAAYWDRGCPGIPQFELLEYLRPVAEALDELFQHDGLLHLTLNPRRLVFKDGRLLMNGFGLMQLLWLPDHWLPPRANPRYAAPELFLGRITPKCDQYSLALIYAEMRTGIHPFARHTPPSHADPDLDLLSSAERAVLLRALCAQAYARFPNSVELILALEATQKIEST